MNKTFFPAVFVLFLVAVFSGSCSKSSSGSGGTNPITPVGTDTTPNIPSNVVDIHSGTSASIALTPYPGYLTIPNLIPILGVGYYFIPLLGEDTITFTVQADSSGGGNGSVAGQTSETSDNLFSSGDSLQFLVTEVQYTGPFGGTGTAYYTNDLALGYMLSSTDTLNFSDSFNGAQIYYSGLSGAAGHNLFNIESYIAFRIKNSTGSRYGWILASSDPSSGNLLSIYEIAFNKNYSQPLPMGKYQ